MSDVPRGHGFRTKPSLLSSEARMAAQHEGLHSGGLVADPSKSVVEVGHAMEMRWARVEIQPVLSGPWWL